LVEKY